MTTRQQVEAELATVFEELVDLIGEAKQAAWTASSAERRRAFDDLRQFLAEQAGVVDEAELQLGGRPDWVRNPTGHHSRNITTEASGDPHKVVDVLVRDLDAAVDDIRRHADNVEGEPKELLSNVAEALAGRVHALRNS
jgi:hypothetical protein